MGCFSFICKESGKPALSTSYDGSPVYLYLLKDGKVIEEMYGNYDSYGRVFNSTGGSFKWKMPWYDICHRLMFDDDDSNGIACVLAEHKTESLPTTRSDPDPNQGWGENGELLSDDSKEFPVVRKPYHKVYYDND